MIAQASAPSLALAAPPAWTRRDPEPIDWWDEAPAERPLGVLTPALRLDGRIDGTPVHAGASVVLTRFVEPITDEDVEGVDGSGGEVLASGWVDLPIGRAFRSQLLRDGPSTSLGAAGAHASVRYVIPARDRWLVTLTFDTSTLEWLLPLVDVFDEIALAATWAD